MVRKYDWELVRKETSIYKIRKGKKVYWILDLGGNRHRTIKAVVLERRGRNLKLKQNNGRVREIQLKASYKNWSDYQKKNATRILKILDRILEKMRPRAKYALKDAKTMRGPYNKESEFNQMLEQIFIIHCLNANETRFVCKYLKQLQKADYIQWKN